LCCFFVNITNLNSRDQRGLVTINFQVNQSSSNKSSSFSFFIWIFQRRMKKRRSRRRRKKVKRATLK
jgi:hypothetical protein